MDTNHTPGPWAIEMERDQQVEIGAEERRLGDGPWEALAVVYGAYDQPEIGAAIMRANAHLIAAAPDLLNALTVLANVAEARGIPCDAARAAIAKAEGE